MKRIVTTLAAAAALAGAASAQQAATGPSAADQIREIAYEFRFSFEPSELANDNGEAALRTRLRGEARDYCVRTTDAAGLSEYAGLCTQIVFAAATERLAEVAEGQRYAAR
jgi:UrcA family protein